MATKLNTPKDEINESDIYHLIDGKCYVSFTAYSELHKKYTDVVIEKTQMIIDQLNNERAHNTSIPIRSKALLTNPHMRISYKRKI